MSLRPLPLASALLVSALLVMPFMAKAAEQAVTIGNGHLNRALLETPPNAKASAIILPGGDGIMNINANGTFTALRGNQLVRSRHGYAARGIATLTVDRDVDIPAAVEYMRKVASPVYLVGTSRGTLRAAQALRQGAKPDGVVLTSGFYMVDAGGPSVQRALGSPNLLPRTLVVHHRKDQCRLTSPEGVEPFKQWGGSKVSVVWLDGGPGGTPWCQARSYHGFQGLDGQVVATVSQFILRR